MQKKATSANSPILSKRTPAPSRFQQSNQRVIATPGNGHRKTSQQAPSRAHTRPPAHKNVQDLQSQIGEDMSTFCSHFPAHIYKLLFTQNKVSLIPLILRFSQATTTGDAEEGRIG